MSTIKKQIGAIRDVLKISKQEVFITDRFIYHLIMEYGKMMIKMEEEKGDLFSNTSMFTVLPFIEMELVPRIDPCYLGFDIGCKILRSKEKLPEFIKSANGPLINYVMSIDGSKKLEPTTRARYLSVKNSSTFKYNRSKYYWFENDYIYLPDNEVESIMISGILDGDASSFYCSEPDSKCKLSQDNNISIPDYLLGEVSKLVLNNLSLMLNIPVDSKDDGQNVVA